MAAPAGLKLLITKAPLTNTHVIRETNEKNVRREFWGNIEVFSLQKMADARRNKQFYCAN